MRRIIDEFGPIVQAEASRLEPVYQEFIANDWPKFLAVRLLLWPSEDSDEKDGYSLPTFDIGVDSRYVYWWTISPALKLAYYRNVKFVGRVPFHVGSFQNLVIDRFKLGHL